MGLMPKSLAEYMRLRDPEQSSDSIYNTGEEHVVLRRGHGSSRQRTGIQLGRLTVQAASFGPLWFHVSLVLDINSAMMAPRQPSSHEGNSARGALQGLPCREWLQGFPPT